MEAQKNIAYISYEDIDKRKWDACINNAANGLLYGYSWFLDSCSDRWDAIVEGDYEAVMPLPLVKRRGKWHIKTISLLSQLGVFSIRPIDDSKMLLFIAEVSKKHKRWKLPLNISNPIHVPRFSMSTDRAYAKDLIYSSKVNKRIAGSDNIEGQGDTMSISKGAQLAVIINFIIRICGNKLKSDEILAIRRIVSFSSRFNFGIAYSVYSSTNNIIGLSYILRFRNRIYMLFSISHESAQKEKIFQMILNRVYTEFENQDYVLECNVFNNSILRSVLLRNGFSEVPFSIIHKRRRLFSFERK